MANLDQVKLKLMLLASLNVFEERCDVMPLLIVLEAILRELRLLRKDLKK